MEGPARDISELTLVCLELAARVDEALTREDKISLITQHIVTYTQEQIPMVDFEAGLEWFNVSRPLTLARDLKGRITVLDFFTYCCVNCMHILPDLEALEKLHPPNDGPNGNPLFVLVGEGHGERLQLCVDSTIEHFSSSGCLTKSSVPLAPSRQFAATGSSLLYPGKVTVHPGGLVVSDSGHNRILMTDYEGNVIKVIGSGKQGFSDGSISNASFNNPQGVAYHHPDVLYIADADNHAIRQVDIVTSTVKTIAGTGKQGRDLEGGLIGTSQAISSPWDICLARSLDQAEDGTDNLLLVAMAGSHQIWGIFLSDGKWLKGSSYSKGTVVRLAGSGAEENRNTSYPTRAGFAQPSGLAIGTNSGTSVLFIADSESSSVRKMSLTDGAVKAVVGAARDPLDLFAYGDIDGSGTDAKLQHPLAVAAVGEAVYVADSYNHKIKVVTPLGKTYKISTVAGGKTTEEIENNVENKKLNEPGGLCASQDHSRLYIADTNNHAIKILSLKDHSLQHLPIRLIDEGDSSSQDLSQDVEEVTAVVPHGRKVEVILRIRTNLTEDTVLNKEAPNKWTIETSDTRVVLTPSSGKLQEVTDVPLTLHLASGTMSQVELMLSCGVFLCLKSGVCVTRSVRYNVKLKSTDSQELPGEDEVIVPINV
ncbi:NHL repeat-containing protein 2 isoform X2 [Procambarus clarkii]|uniref:NHL repeat-containing protein 2 isoform X2 n=1 Tax=Procambarus clarkii TaxID=6728 RepID=UPI0037444151